MEKDPARKKNNLKLDNRIKQLIQGYKNSPVKKSIRKISSANQYAD